MKARVKAGLRATVSTPSLRTIVSRGVLSAEMTDRGPCASIKDTQTDSRVLLPFGYVPTCGSAPTDSPNEYNGFVPVRIDVFNNVIYYYYQDTWLSIQSGSSGGIYDCPDDGKLYVRSNGAWVELNIT